MSSLDDKFALIPTTNNEIINPDITMTHEIITSESKASMDFEQARKAISDAMKVGSKAVVELGEFASQAQMPEPYTALSSLIKTISDAGSTLLKVHKQLEELTSRQNADKKTELHNHLHLPMQMSTHQLSETLKLISSKKDDPSSD